MPIRVFIVAAFALLLAACAGTPPAPPAEAPAEAPAERAASAKGNEVALFALGLIDTGYRFGGKNPEAGLDCSGMVSYIYRQAAGLDLKGSAADIAQRGRPVPREALRSGDLVFFNTSGAPYSHVGLYIGQNRFVHAPSGNGRVRIDVMSSAYYARRFSAARTYFD